MKPATFNQLQFPMDELIVDNFAHEQSYLAVRSK